VPCALRETQSRPLKFLDESGDPGAASDGGSSLFVIGLVVFDSAAEAERCDRAISRLRVELRKPPSYEFRFRDNPDPVRRALMALVAPFAFTYYAAVHVKVPTQQEFGRDLYLTACSHAIGMIPDLTGAIAILDEATTDRRARTRITAELRRRVNADAGVEALARVKMQASAKNNLLQLADYVTGAVTWAASPRAKMGAESYLALLRWRSGTVRHWTA
jgi:hypothetical protein